MKLLPKNTKIKAAPLINEIDVILKVKLEKNGDSECIALSDTYI